MKKFTRHYRRMKYIGLGTIFISFLGMYLLVPSMEKPVANGDNYFKIYLNSVYVGAVHNQEESKELLTAARAMLARESKELVLMEPDLKVTGSSVLFGKTNTRDYIINYMYGVLSESILKTRARAYTVKVNEFSVNLRTADEVLALLNTAMDQYDPAGEYDVALVLDSARELNVLTTKVSKSEDNTVNNRILPLAGVENVIDNIMDNAMGHSDEFDLGLKSLDFGDRVEVVEAYVGQEEIVSLDAAVEMLTKDLEKNILYEVQQGDVLSTIAEKTNVPMEKIIALNEHLENENSVIRAGEELIVTIPEPELSIVRQEKIYTEENYNAPVEYVDNDSWFTSEQKTIQQPVEGHRKAVSLVSYKNNSVTEREVVWEDISMEAVPRIIERGTKVPPSYVKPISGGRLTSNYGARWGRTHKGTDWACPIGTEVRASSAGTVARAGWGSGYGYVVYINHADGRQTRYGHLSKVLVKAGQTVKQGERIALSGNTGRSTGPHIHFEILINGSQVNALKYLN